jgi:hypothetical protein
VEGCLTSGLGGCPKYPRVQSTNISKSAEYLHDQADTPGPQLLSCVVAKYEHYTTFSKNKDCFRELVKEPL